MGRFERSLFCRAGIVDRGLGEQSTNLFGIQAEDADMVLQVFQRL